MQDRAIVTMDDRKGLTHVVLNSVISNDQLSDLEWLSRIFRNTEHRAASTISLSLKYPVSFYALASSYPVVTFSLLILRCMAQALCDVFLHVCVFICLYIVTHTDGGGGLSRWQFGWHWRIGNGIAHHVIHLRRVSTYLTDRSRVTSQTQANSAWPFFRG